MWQRKYRAGRVQRPLHICSFPPRKKNEAALWLRLARRATPAQQRPPTCLRVARARSGPSAHPGSSSSSRFRPRGPRSCYARNASVRWVPWAKGKPLPGPAITYRHNDRPKNYYYPGKDDEVAQGAIEQRNIKHPGEGLGASRRTLLPRRTCQTLSEEFCLCVPDDRARSQHSTFVR